MRHRNCEPAHHHHHMSRRQEIKHKEALQARFQLAMAQNTSLAAQWLGEDPHLAPAAASGGQQEFFSLPIVANGASLSELSVVKLGKTVGDFFTGATKTPLAPLNGLGARKSLAMQALSNKIRDDRRAQVRGQVGQVRGQVRGQVKGQVAKPGKQGVAKVKSKPAKPLAAMKAARQDLDSEDDDEMVRARTFVAKKATKKRPF